MLSSLNRAHSLVLDGVYDHIAYTEKSLARLVKAKVKAERTAARQAQYVQSYAFAGASIPSSSTTAMPAPHVSGLMSSSSCLSSMLTTLSSVTSGVHTLSQNLTDRLAPRILNE